MPFKFGPRNMGQSAASRPLSMRQSPRRKKADESFHQGTPIDAGNKSGKAFGQCNFFPRKEEISDAWARVGRVCHWLCQCESTSDVVFKHWQSQWHTSAGAMAWNG